MQAFSRMSLRLARISLAPFVDADHKRTVAQMPIQIQAHQLRSMQAIREQQFAQLQVMRFRAKT
jgi:hypothetical protein